MRHKKGVVQLAPSGDNKPVAPPNLWEQLDALRPKEPVRPEGSFTATEYQRKFDITPGKAKVQLNRMLAEGKLVRQGIYYLVANANL
jgi:hypothetical protein